MNNKIRCACGKSQQMPWCDGSHKNSQWDCESQIQQPIARGILCAPALANLAKRICWRFDAQAMQLNMPQNLPNDSKSSVQLGNYLVIIDDGSGINQLKQTLASVEFQQVLYVAIDFEPQAIATALGIKQYVNLSGELLDIFVQLESMLAKWYQGSLSFEHQPLGCPSLKRLFISHAVADESVILPAIESLRQLTDIEVFMCFDSIKTGEKWRRQIDSSLTKSDVFISMISASSLPSTYCAYEVGFAQALQKPMYLISLDGSLPPAFISHIHALDLPREIAAKPWLDQQSSLIMQLIVIINSACAID